MADGSLLFDTKLDGSGLSEGAIKLGGIAAKGLAAIGAAAAGATAAIVKVGSDFETSMAKVKTLADTTQVSMADLSKGLMEISNTTGQSSQSLAEALYQALSAGVQTGDALAYTEQAAKLAAAGFTTTESAVDALSTVMNAYKMDASEVNAVSDMLLQTQNKGKTTVDELAASIAQVTPTAAAMGVEFEQVSAALATMTAQGVPTSQATTQLNQLFAELGKSGQQASENLMKAAEGTEYAGMSFQELMDAGVPLNKVLNMMSDYAEANGKSLLDMFGSIEAGKAALTMAGENSKTFANNLKAMNESAGLTEDGFTTMTDTLQGKIGILKESFSNLGISIYQGMQKPLKGLADVGIQALDKLMAAFNEGGMEGLIQAGSNVIANLLTGIAESLPTLAEQGINIAVTLLNAIIEQLPTILDAGVQAIMALVTGISEALPQLIPAALNSIMTFINSLLSNFPQIISAGLQLITALVQGIVNSLPQVLQSANQAISSFISGIASSLPQIIQSGFEIVTSLASGIIRNLPAILSAVFNLTTAMFQAFLQVDWLSVGINIVSGIISGLWSMAGALVDAMVSMAKSAFDGILGFFGIKSPSRLMRDRVGKYIPQGVAVGAEKEIPKSVKQMNSAWDRAIEEVRPFAIDYEANESRVPATTFGSSYEGDTNEETNNEYNYDITQNFYGDAAKKPSEQRKQTKKALRQMEWETKNKKKKG